MKPGEAGGIARRTFIGRLAGGAGYLAFGALIHGCKKRSRKTPSAPRRIDRNPCISNVRPVSSRRTVPFTQDAPRVLDSNKGFSYVPVKGAGPCIRAVVDSTDRSRVYGFINIGEMDYTALLNENGDIAGWDFDGHIDDFNTGKMRRLTGEERANLKRGNSYRAVWDSLRKVPGADELVHGGRRIIYLPPAQEIVELRASFNGYIRGLSER